MKAILPQRTSSSKRSRRTDLVTAVINNGMPAPQASTSPTRKSTPSQQQVFGHAGTQPESESQGNEQLDSTGSQKENSPGSVDSDKSGPPSNATPPKRTKNTSKTKVADQSPADVRLCHPTQCLRRLNAGFQHMSTKAVVPRASMNPPIAAIVRTKEMNPCDPSVPSSETIPYYGGSVSRPAIAPARGTARAPRKRSPSPASQDSFAGPLPAEDQEKLYLQHTKAFNVPLSELGQLSHSTHSRSVAEQSATTRTQEVNATTEQRVMLSSPPSSPSHVARILVAATPEISSDDSQEIYAQSGRSFPSHSQAVNPYRRGDGSQLSDEFTAGQGQEVGGSYGHHDDGRLLGSTHAVPAAASSSFPDDGSTELTSSYETPTHKAIVDMGLFELSPEFMEPTQPYEPEPTQLRRTGRNRRTSGANGRAACSSERRWATVRSRSTLRRYHNGADSGQQVVEHAVRKEEERVLEQGNPSTCCAFRAAYGTRDGSSRYRGTTAAPGTAIERYRREWVCANSCCWTCGSPFAKSCQQATGQ